MSSQQKGDWCQLGPSSTRPLEPPGVYTQAWLQSCLVTVMYLSEPGFLGYNTVGIWGWIILCGGSHLHCRMLSSIPGFYPVTHTHSPWW